MPVLATVPSKGAGVPLQRSKISTNPTLGSPKAEGIIEMVPLRLSKSEAALVRMLEKTKAARNKRLTEKQKTSVLEIYSRLYERSKELAKLLKRGSANAKVAALRKELTSVKRIKARLASLLIATTAPPHLSEEEKLLIKPLEKTKAKRKVPLTREEEVFVFKIYSRFSERAELLESALEVQSTNGEERDVRRELAAVKKTEARLASIIIMTNDRFVVGVTNGLKNGRYLDADVNELLQDGYVGALVALDKFDYKRGYRFCTLAEWWIKQSINRATADTGRMVRLPVHVLGDQGKINKLVRDYHNGNMREPTVEEISKASGIPEAKVEKVIELRSGVCQLNERTLPDPNPTQIVNVIARRELREALSRLLNRLTPREREIIERRFGLNGKDGKEETLEFLGNDKGVSRERIRQIQNAAIEKLRRWAKQMGLEDY